MKKLIAAIMALSSVGYTDAADYDKSSQLQDFYNTWKRNYLVQDSYVTDETQYYVWYSGNSYNNDNISVPVTVSEAHGYGMLITACLADYDSNSKDIFDGMYRYYKSHTSSIGKNLMSWQQCDNGSELIDGAEDGAMNGGSADSATDGDMDIAYSLLIADKIWGSSGDIDYKSEAVNIINDIMEYEVNKTDWILQLGDWVYYESKDDDYYSATRASDFIMQYMPVFAEVTGDSRWLDVYESTYRIIDSFTDKYNTGLLPDFIVKDSQTGEFVAAPEYFLEDYTDNCYSYNSCRIPWRISMDYLINGNETAKKFADTINNFIIEKTNSNPDNIMAGYKTDGSAFEDYNDLCFDAPFLVSAKCGDNTEWQENLWSYICDYGDDVYYGDTIKLLCMIAYCDEWQNIQGSTMYGDVNTDGVIDVVDVTALKQAVLEIISLTPQQTLNSDVINDGVTDVKDLGQLIRYIIKIIDKF